VDADTLGLAHVLIRVRNDVTYCGDDGDRPKNLRNLPPAEVQATKTPDDEWIPTVTRAGLAIITRDRHIGDKTREKDIVLTCGARMFAITSPEQLDNWGMLEVVVTQWRAMETAAAEPGPYIYSLTRTGMNPINLPPVGVRRPTRRGAQRG
jgi:hypothetical protein